MNDIETIFIDGSIGEGGGQILRTSLALSCITGKRLHIENIRSARRNPGLAKQHLSCVQAACQICNGKSRGAAQGSKVLNFQASPVHSGDFRFDIGSAGSASLVIQTVLPALFLADKSSIVTVTGGTHNPLAPPFDFLWETFLPAIKTAGFQSDCKLLRHGFFPAGGGKITLHVQPWQKQSNQTINLCDSDQEFRISARIYTAKLPTRIAHHQQKLLLQSGLNIQNIEHTEVRDSEGPGNAVCIRLCCNKRTTVLTAFGMRGKPSEQVISEIVSSVMHFVDSGAAVEHFLADQLLLYMAIANGGCFTTDRISAHTKTNMEVIKRFLPVDFIIEEQRDCFRVSCQPDQ
ncbi:RNA 3'-terminal phosphate cyclase [subsurface metagenome]